MIRKCDVEVGTPSLWNLAFDGALGGLENMRRDQESLDNQRDSAAVPCVRIYRWARPTVSYGRLQSQPDPRPAGYDLVQRPTGGGMVFHGTDVSFSVAWRRDHPGLPPCIKNVYRLFHGSFADELRQVGLNAGLHSSPDPRPAVPGACYKDYATDDVIVDGLKWIGGALRVTSWGRLYQGNIKAPPAVSATPILDEAWVARVFESRVFRYAPTYRLALSSRAPILYSFSR